MQCDSAKYRSAIMLTERLDFRCGF